MPQEAPAVYLAQQLGPYLARSHLYRSLKAGRAPHWSRRRQQNRERHGSTRPVARDKRRCGYRRFVGLNNQMTTGHSGWMALRAARVRRSMAFSCLVSEMAPNWRV